MERKYITDCSNYFNYGYIDESIASDSFLWQEYEDIDITLVAKHIESKSTYPNIYFFMSKMCFYPLTFRDKYLGLWGEMKKNYGLEIIQSYEDKMEFNRFLLYFGIAEIKKTHLDLVLKLLKMDFMHSYIMLSSDNFNSKQNSDNMLKLSDSGSDYILNYSKLINSYCKTNDLVTTIYGSNGTTINYFYHLKN